LSAEATELIDDPAGNACRWFLDHAHPQSGLVRDRAPNLDFTRPATNQASIAASGFYLTLLPELERRGMLSSPEAAKRASTAIDFVLGNVDHVHGILPHFLHWQTGARWRNSEYSVLDTAIFLHGCITAAQAYPAVRKAADDLIGRVDWTKLWAFSPRHKSWLLSYGYAGSDRSLLPGSADVRSAENLMPCLLAVASPTHPLGPECWYHMRIDRWKEEASTTKPAPPADSYAELRSRVINPGHPLFTSQYGLLWADLHGLHDADGIDLSSNAKDAALLNRAYCRQIAAKTFRTYDAANGGWWGLSAGDSPRGYVAPGPDEGDPDATVWPTAALASVQWIHDVLDVDLKQWRASPSWAKVKGKYGLAPFSIVRNWTGNDLIGIDLGSFACAAANARTGLIERLWASHPVAQVAVRKLEFSGAASNK
jgi:hypothetical protein